MSDLRRAQREGANLPRTEEPAPVQEITIGSERREGGRGGVKVGEGKGAGARVFGYCSASYR